MLPIVFFLDVNGESIRRSSIPYGTDWIYEVRLGDLRSMGHKFTEAMFASITAMARASDWKLGEGWTEVSGWKGGE